MHYDKPRIISTVILGIFIVAAMILCFSFYGVWWAGIKESAETASESQESAGGQVAAGLFTALAGAFVIVLVIAIEIASVIVSSICLPFAIKNRKSTLKPVRIISYVYDGLLVITLLAAVVKLFLLIVFQV